MFKRIVSAAAPDAAASSRGIAFTFDGRPMTGAPGDTVAAALLANGVRAGRRTPASGSARGPYCMMGVCFECLVEIDGVPARQSCMVPVQEGMKIRRQDGAVELVDLSLGEKS